MKHVPQSKLSKIGALLLHRVTVERNKREPQFDVTGAFIPICSFQKAFNRHLFLFSEHHVKTFILNSIPSIVIEREKNGFSSEERPITMTVLKELLANSTTLQNVFLVNMK